MGVDFWHTYGIPEHGVPSVRFSDGPNGVRGTRLFGGPPATCLPCGTALAATWDEDLLNKAGKLLGQECRAKRVDCLLGPTLDILRSPLFGRGFEGLGEDPHLTGTLGAAIIRGIKSRNVMAAVKHFVAYNQEDNRRGVDVQVTQRALCEIYLRPFQIVARNARPDVLLTAYNKVNGTHVSESVKLLDEIVRKAWKWNPIIISDWVGTYSTAEALNAGLDLEMPGPTRRRGDAVQRAIDCGIVQQSTLDKCARKVLQFARCASGMAVASTDPGDEHVNIRELNRRLCSSSIVLLKNQRSILPLPPNVRSVALIGSHMKRPAICGGGSAQVDPEYAVSLYDALREALPETTEVTYAPGQYAHKTLPLIELNDGFLAFYNSSSTDTSRFLVGREPIRRTGFKLMDYDGMPKLDQERFWVTLTGTFRPDTTGEWEFGLAVYGTANLYIDDELVIENTTEQVQGTAFFGMGTVEKRECKYLLQGQLYNIIVEFGSANTSPLLVGKKANFPGGALHVGACPKLEKDQALTDAVAAARDAEYTIVCTGLSEDWESEGFDRPSMDLPPGVDELIRQVLKVSPRAVIVNQSGTPVAMPWAKDAPCIVQAWYGGNETGYGVADVLLGKINPSGKLPFSWPVDVQDNPSFRNFGPGTKNVYIEDVYVGYRFYEKVGKDVLFPFGYGLSYTTFQLCRPHVVVSEGSTSPVKPFVASLYVTNIGQQAGAEVLQVYIAPAFSAIDRPLKELCGFRKVFLEPGQQARVDIAIDCYAGSYWCETDRTWVTEKGVYTLFVGRSSQDILGVGKFQVNEERRWVGL